MAIRDLNAFCPISKIVAAGIAVRIRRLTRIFHEEVGF